MSFTLRNAHVIPVFNNLATLQQWLRPGFTSFVIGAHIDAMRSTAIRIAEERAQMLDEAAMRYPDVYPDTDPDETKRGAPHPQAGQVVTINNGQVTLYRSKEAGDEFKRRETELMDAESVFELRDDLRISYTLLRKLDGERLNTPRVMNGAEASDISAVDFSVLIPIVLDDASTAPIRRK